MLAKNTKKFSTISNFIGMQFALKYLQLLQAKKNWSEIFILFYFHFRLAVVFSISLFIIL